LRAVKVVWQREMIRFVRSKGRLISGLAQPLLLLFVLGSCLSGLTRRARAFGFLREMLVAPVPRSAILVGKCLGGAAIATLQALILVALAGLVGGPGARGG